MFPSLDAWSQIRPIRRQVSNLIRPNKDRGSSRVGTAVSYSLRQPSTIRTDSQRCLGTRDPVRSVREIRQAAASRRFPIKFPRIASGRNSAVAVVISACNWVALCRFSVAGQRNEFPCPRLFLHTSSSPLRRRR